MQAFARVLRNLTKPLWLLVKERNFPDYCGTVPTRGIVNPDGEGFAANAWGDIQAGGEGASLLLSPDDGMMVLFAEEIFTSGQLRIVPGQSGRALEVNGGQLNPELAPPLATPDSTPPGLRHAPRAALLTVRTEAVGPSNLAVPEQMPSVIVPPHTHTVVVGGVPGRTVETVSWGGPGVSYEAVLEHTDFSYLFGYNHLPEYLKRNTEELLTIDGSLPDTRG